MVEEMDEKLLKNYKHKQIAIWILCAIVIMISGIIIGAGGTILLAKNNIIWISHKHKNTDEIVRTISRRYELTPQQTEQVREIIGKTFEKMKLYNEQMDKQREADAQALIAEMNSVLTPAQFERWYKDFQDMQQKFKKRFKTDKKN